MPLEVIERGSEGAGAGPPLVFVHGYWQAAWCWDESVLPELADRGHRVVALSLTGHGRSDGRIRGRSISDNVDDLVSVVESLDVPPVVVGHSMGGFTVQHYLSSGQPARGAVLVAPVPRRGAWGATLKAARRHPGAFLKTNLTLDVGAMVETEERAYDLLFGPAVPPQRAAYYSERWERASYRTYLDLLFNRPRPRPEVPMLIVGGTEDALFGVAEWERTAADWNAELVIIEGAGHQVMLEPAGAELVDLIDRFVGALG